MRGIIFSNCFNIDQEDTFIARINSDISNIDEFFDALVHSCKFPYFGFNWNALNDVFRDFEWIDEKNIVVFHENPLALSQEDLIEYIDIIAKSFVFLTKTTKTYVMCLMKKIWML